MVVLDTNILIDTLRQKTGTVILAKILGKVAKEDLAIAVVSVQELYQGKSIEDVQKEQDLQDLIAPLEVLPYSYDVAKLAGEIVRKRNYTITFPDAAIAATALINNAQLVTLNPKDFTGIKDLELYKI